ncbi:MAG: hypothetical protein ICV66_06160 [Chitinophagaceae bacterium]|nr:hypothetical protein [Chitinophagaceae bacterium]
MRRLFFLIAIAINISGFAQKVSNRLNFPKGQKLEMTTQVNSVITQEMMGQPMEIKVNATITRNFDIEDVNANGATIEHKIKRIQFNFDGMGQSHSFDSEKESDMKGEMGKEIEKNLKKKYTMTVDQIGKVTSVKLDDDNPNKSGEKDNADMMDAMMSQFAAGLKPPSIGDVIDLKILPDREVGKGDTWTDTANNGKKIFTVADITSTDVVLNFTEDIKVDRKQEAQGMEITISSNDKSTGKVVLDRKTGLLKESTSTTASEGTTSVMGQSMPLSTKLTKTVTVKGL